MRNDSHGIFGPGIIGRDDGLIRKSSGYFAHLKPSGRRSVSAASEDRYDLAFGVLLKIQQDVLQCSRIMCIIDQDIETELVFYRLKTARNADRSQSASDAAFIDACAASQCDGTKSIGNIESAGKRNKEITGKCLALKGKTCTGNVISSLELKVLGFEVSIAVDAVSDNFAS